MAYLSAGKYTQTFVSFFGKSRRYNSVAMCVSRGVVQLARDEEADAQLRGHLDLAQRHSKELLVSSLVDNFQSYIADLLESVFQLHPEIISGQKTDNALIFQFSSIDELKLHIVRRSVSDLSYRGIDDLAKYFREKLKFDLVSGRLSYLKLARLIQIRNLVAHNRGVVNHQFKDRIGSKADVLGREVFLPSPSMVDHFLISLAEQVDRRAITKFNLPHFDFEPSEDG